MKCNGQCVVVILYLVTAGLLLTSLAAPYFVNNYASNGGLGSGGYKGGDLGAFRYCAYGEDGEDVQSLCESFVVDNQCSFQTTGNPSTTLWDCEDWNAFRAFLLLGQLLLGLIAALLLALQYLSWEEQRRALWKVVVGVSSLASVFLLLSFLLFQSWVDAGSGGGVEVGICFYLVILAFVISVVAAVSFALASWLEVGSQSAEAAVSRPAVASSLSPSSPSGSQLAFAPLVSPSSRTPANRMEAGSAQAQPHPPSQSYSSPAVGQLSSAAGSSAAVELQRSSVD